ncbi:MAG: class I SAM-dependent methyltransferase [Candidatus Magasanikbacteria bacterium]|nr:class I SAM-dependent methyltransferase [Candidatus Magasanikbacteria bacterium]
MPAKNLGYQTRCQICGARPLETILALGHQPIVQEYLTRATRHQPEVTYPLNLVRCPKCGLLQLDYIVDPRLVFPKHYPYRTGLTNMLIRNFRELANCLIKKYRLRAKDLVVDIGSNDGTLLQGFRAKGIRVLGIEPTDAAQDANQNGIPTIQSYLNAAAVNRARKKYGPARVVTATNVFAHILDVPELMRNIKKLLAPNGVFVSESQYLADIFTKREFDTIYHEHLRFYALKPLVKLFRRHGMSLVDAERIAAAGGSIRVFAAWGRHPLSSRAKKLIAAEEQLGLYRAKTLQEWAGQIKRAKQELLALLLRCKQEGARIAGVGSPARANTLLGYTHLDSDLLDYTVEKAGSPKIGLFTPGSHLPVVAEEKLLADQPEYALILSWHIGPELMKILRAKGYRGQFIMPLPQPRIITKR